MIPINLRHRRRQQGKVLALTGRTAVVCPPFRVWWCAPPFALAILWATFQTLGFSPESWHHPIWRGASEALGLPYAGSISLNPAPNPRERLRLLIDEFLPRNGLLLGGWLMLAVALMLSESRGGVAATALALSVFFSVLAARYVRKARGLALRATLPLLAATALFGLSGEGLQRQFLHVESDWLKRI